MKSIKEIISNIDQKNMFDPDFIRQTNKEWAKELYKLYLDDGNIYVLYSALKHDLDATNDPEKANQIADMLGL